MNFLGKRAPVKRQREREKKREIVKEEKERDSEKREIVKEEKERW